MARPRGRNVAGPQYELPEPELIVVANPAAGVRARPEGVTAAAADAPALARILPGGARLQPLFGASEERLLNEAVAAEAVGLALPDLSVYYRVEGAKGDLEALAGKLAGHEAVVAAYVKPPAEPAERLNDMAPAALDAPPATPDFSARQGYLDASPAGIDARWAWTQPGGSGAGVRIIDIEGGWRFTHEDLVQGQGGVIGGTMSTDLGWVNHGTAVVGEFGGDRNTFGVTGICPDANVRAISIFGGPGSAGAIRQAANALSPGDIILIELHRPGPRHGFANRADQLGYIAIEWWDDDFAAILYATGRGVIVVEAAGNGAENLDDPLYGTAAPGFPAAWRNPFNRALRDSGAILVGAGAPPPGTHGRDHGPDRSRLGFSNFGSAVDAQGWGREVTTTGYGDLQGGANQDLWYTDQFSGTSSASPIVVGAVGCLQGIKRAAGTPWTPAQVRNWLRSSGSPQQDAPGRPATQRIGNRPNLRALAPKILKEGLKDHKAEKLEKVEKVEKLEIKERKLEKLEIKERKLEKIESKELKPEKELVKERKPEIEVKVRDLKRIDEVKGLNEVRLDRDILRGGGGGPAAAGESVEDRLAAVEGAVTELLHFISGDLRPDLGQGALAQEQDLRAISQELDKNASDAKQAKDAKDVEKVSEY
jgi:hypothetical protein